MFLALTTSDNVRRMRGVRGWAWLVVIAWGVLGAQVAHAQLRALYWREVGVKAALDAEGRLQVEERQVIVFTGDWNGGERRFRLDKPHELVLRSITRIDSDGKVTPLVQSDQLRKDQYAWSDGPTLRWRSREPDEPPFKGREITYILSYALSNILIKEAGDTYRLDHDFGFTGRPGYILRFTLDLTLDPVWLPENGFPSQQTWDLLAPGVGAVVRFPLHYRGDGEPSASNHVASSTLRHVCVALLLGLLALVFGGLFWKEARIGRFAPLPPARSIDAAWLRRHILPLKPELVGATYDRSTAAAEVAAMIARMHQEQKLASRVVKGAIPSQDNLEMWLLVDRSRLVGDELALIRKLFFAGNETSTQAIRQHYGAAQFDPAAYLMALTAQVDIVLGVRDMGKWHLRLTLALLALCVVGIVAAYADGSVPALWFVCTGMIWATALFSGVGLAAHWQSTASRLAFCSCFGLSAIATLALVRMILAYDSIAPIVVLGLTLMGVTLFAVVALIAPSREHPAGVALRQRLLAAKRYFSDELAKPSPHIEDAWFPYLIALDLAKDIDRWFLAFGSSSGGSSMLFSSNNSSSSASSHGTGSSSGGGWSGGGGAFGGAGATASWAAAAGALAAGVGSSSSSSGGSSGSSSSSSSGGGGGGGW